MLLCTVRTENRLILSLPIFCKIIIIQDWQCFPGTECINELRIYMEFVWKLFLDSPLQVICTDITFISHLSWTYKFNFLK